jgi:oligopeptide transport system ATP-binding protein
MHPMIADASPQPLLEVADLKTHFPVKAGLLKSTVAHVKAVDGVTFTVNRGETLGLVGESGCGKTTVGRTILRLIDKTDGSVTFNETLTDDDGDEQIVQRNIYALSGSELKRMRRKMQIIFQDPVGSLNPRMTVGRIVGEPMQVHGIAKGSELQDRVGQLLDRVGLSPDYASRYPHEFSGGQRQRIGIARALGLGPDFIVCDEPVSALDVSIQSQILNLLNDLQDEMGIAYLFIAHNLAVVEQFSDRVAVMYLGRIVEVADRDDLYRQPLHPYTQALMSAVPEPKPVRDKGRIVLPGEVPSPMNPPTGCHFHPRCPLTRTLAGEADAGETVEITIEGQTDRVIKRCTTDAPPLEIGPSADETHCVACHFAKEGLETAALPPLPG